MPDTLGEDRLLDEWREPCDGCGATRPPCFTCPLREKPDEEGDGDDDLQ